MFERILKRFIRGLIAGAVATMIMVVPPNISDFHGLMDWLQMLVLAGIIGGINGGLLAVDKWFRDRKSSNK